MITRTISKWEFQDEFKETYSKTASEHLYYYLMNLSDDIGKDIDFDPVAISIEWKEYEDLEEYLDTYYTKEEIKELREEYPDEDDFKEYIKEAIEDETTLIMFSDDLNDGFLIQFNPELLN